MLDSLSAQLTKKGLTGFDPKSYPMRVIRERVLQRHPLLARWGGPIRGRAMGWADLMFRESEVILGTMLTLMSEDGVPSYPVYDSIIVPATKYKLARETLINNFRKQTGVVPTVKPEKDPEDWFDELIADRKYQFVYCFTPAPIKGATGSNGCPIAIT
ncbi:hypothetical protein [Bradyrhizobium sp. sBnM-33]|uniref:hypothetical protein n=1 Tax=Bradyrhizobium sp. sBnM-33 TaxID=2831780 RepID=UPI001BCDCF31|nr:hypothetical protein [Bradyrhizobium sp. sBnM-33]WOH53511.1 hypothetical protein RX328_16310 [Bradyrhizobium sp. sBnM-33]